MADVKYQTSSSHRCSWCWEQTPAREVHAIVESPGPYPLEQRFHLKCWVQFQTLSPAIQWRSGTTVNWTPLEAEKLRIGAGLTASQFCRELGIGELRFLDLLSLNEPLPEWLSQKVTAVRNRYPTLEFVVDWSNPSAVYGFRQHLGLSIKDLSARLGIGRSPIRRYEFWGIDYLAKRAANRYEQLAAKTGYGIGDVPTEHLWTKEHLKESIKNSNTDLREWQIRSGKDRSHFWKIAEGNDPITRHTAYLLTQLAYRFGAPLPPEGIIRPAIGAQRKPYWHENSKSWKGQILGKPFTLGDNREEAVAKYRELLKEHLGIEWNPAKEGET